MIQPLAYIHPQAKIADNVVIEPFVTIHKDVEDWRGYLDRIKQHHYGWRHESVKTAAYFPGAVVSAPPQDLKYRGEQSTVTVGDNTDHP